MLGNHVGLLAAVLNAMPTIPRSTAHQRRDEFR